MIRSTLVVCSIGASVDRFTNNLSIFDVIEKFQPQSYPFYFPKVIGVCVLERDDGDPDKYNIRVRLMHGNKALLDQKVRIDFDGRHVCHQIINIQGVHIEQPGKLTLKLHDDNNKKKKLGQYDMQALKPVPIVEKQKAE